MNAVRCSLPDLPAELIEIVAYLIEDKKDLLALRSTCVAICTMTQIAFRRIFYHTIETSLSVTSMQRLHHIAKNKDLSKHVKQLHFVPRGKITRDNLRDNARNANRRTLYSAFGIGYTWREESSVWEGIIKFDCPVIHDLCILLTTSFVHCRSFRIGRDAADWALGDYRHQNCITTVDVLAVVLRVIALTGIKTQSLAVRSTIWSSEECTASPARHYPPKAWHFGNFEDGWSGLHSLDVEMNEPNFDPGLTSVGDSAINNGRIISTAKGLRRLRLSFNDYEGQDLLLHELCKSGFSPPELETLVLDLSQVSVDALTPFLSRAWPSLNALIFQNMTLEGGTWNTILSSLTDPIQFPKLRNITIAGVRQSTNRQSGGYLSFRYFRNHRLLPAPHEDERFELLDMKGSARQGGLQGIRYRGENVNTAVNVLLEHLQFLNWSEASKNEEDVMENDFDENEWMW
jgi:hypothetical protein